MRWDDIWANVQLHFVELAADVKAGTKDVASRSGRTAAESFPFGAYLSFGREGDASREDVVVSIDCRSVAESAVFSCDIARGDGYVLRDGPTLSVARSDVEASPEVEKWVADVSAFLRVQSSLIRNELLSLKQDGLGGPSQH